MFESKRARRSFYFIFSLAMLSLLMLISVLSVAAAAGDLDTAFDTDRMVTTNFPGTGTDLGGTISGTIYEADGVTPITTGVWVQALVSNGQWLNGIVNPDGSYIINGLPAGAYYVSAGGNGFVRESYNNAGPNGNSGNLVNVVVGSDTPNIDFSLDPGGAVSGTVYEADGLTPIPFIGVNVDGPGYGFGVCADANGHFTFDGILPLNVELRTRASVPWLNCAGPKTYAQEYWQEVANWNSATTLTLTTAVPSLANINFTLDPGGTISGMVADENGNPLVNANVCGNFLDNSGGIGCVQTGADGSYAFPGLATGSYRLDASASSFAREFYHERAFAQQADPVVVTAGVETPNINFTLGPAGTISGTVTDANGEPLANIGVDIENGGQGTCTDSSGHFTLSLAYGTYKIAAGRNFCGNGSYVEEYWPETPDRNLATPLILSAANNQVSGIDFTLDLGGTISGTIYEADGLTPIPDIVVSAGTPNFGMGTCTDANGHYTFTGLALGLAWHVGAADGNNWCGGSANYVRQYWIDKPDWTSADVIVLTPYNMNVSGIDFTLNLGGSFSGTVYDSDGSTPLAGAEVCADGYDSNSGYGCASTLADGSYILAGLPDGDYRVQARKAGYAQKFYNNTYSGGAAARVQVQPGQNPNNINFVLEPGGTVSGTVYQSDGITAIPNIGVNLEGDGYGMGACADANGNYMIESVPLNVPVRMRASIPWLTHCAGEPSTYAQEWWQNVPNSNNAASITLTNLSPDATGIDFTLDVGGTISGTVYQSDGITPIPNIGVNLDGDGYGKGICADANGNFSFTALPLNVPFRVRAGIPWLNCAGPKTYAQEFWQESSNWNSATILTLTTAVPSLSNINFTLDLGGTISGAVADENGTPLVNANVCGNFFDNNGGGIGCVQTGADGSYAFPGLAVGSYRLDASAPGFAREFYLERAFAQEADPVVVTAGVETPNVNFTLALAGAIFGTVTDANGQPLANIGVDIENGGQGTCTDSSGHFTLSLAYGTYKIAAGRNFCGNGSYVEEYWQETPDHNLATPLTLSAANDLVSGIDFTLDLGGTISGTVADENGQPIAGGNICATSTENEVFVMCLGVEADGTYRITGLPTGAYRMHIDAPPGYVSEYYDSAFFAGQATPVLVTAPGEITGIDFSLEVGGTISGTVRDKNGTPITGVSVGVRLENPADGQLGQTVCTDPATGQFTFSNVAFNAPVAVSAGFAFCGADIYGIEYWQEATTLQLAAPITLTSGAPDEVNIDFTLSDVLPFPEVYTFNLDDPILAELAVRQAIAYGTDRQRILVDAFLPNNVFGALLNSYIPPEYWAAAPASALTLYPYDPALARQILANAGWIDSDNDGVREKGGQRLALTFQTTNSAARVAAAEIFRQNMAAIGLEITVETMNPGEFFGDTGPLVTRTFDIAEFAWGGGAVDDDEQFPLSGWVTGDPQNYGNYSNPLADAEYTAAHAATTREDKLPHIVEHQVILSQDLPILPLFARRSVQPVSAPEGNNVTADPAPNLTITFDSVTQGGVVTVINTGANPADLPPNFELLGTVYDVGSNVQFTQATACFDYDDTGLAPSDEAQLKLYHLENGSWTDVTDAGYPDTVANRICGTVSNFSPFAILFPTVQPPVLGAISAPANPVQVNTAITVTAPFTDPNADDTHTAAWSWGDGTTSAGTVNETSHMATGQHTYAAAGLYTVTLTLTDSSNLSAEATFQYVVVYDPNGGFVTGSGWITSPAGAYVADPTLTGKAKFEFEVKYHKGMNVLTGETKFKFKAGDLDFKGTSNQWLVVRGAKAQFAGSGTINGQGDYGFQITVIDGKKKSGNGPDLIRIKIWKKATGQVIYDSQLGAVQDADPATVLGDGSIMIHKVKAVTTGHPGSTR